MVERAGVVPVIAPGARLDRYLRVRIEADPGRPAGDQIITITPSVVEVSRPVGTAPAAPPDPEIARALAGWQAKVDAALGEEIGWLGVDLRASSAEIGRWVTGAWRAELGVEVAVLNRYGLRQSLPRGPITKASVWSVMPFDDALVVLRMKGSALARTLAEESAVVGGATRDGGHFWVGGAPLDPERVYSVATTDYLYDDGHLGLRHALSAERAGDWRAPVIAWTQKQRSTKDAPLERLLR
jgi:2',3'-cyclic-nucleotide 2'-phosphodiesterase (5'-nucleotidase family)